MTPFRIAHLSDVHLCERVRFAGTCRVLEAFADDVARLDVDLVLIAGDLVDPRRAPAKATPTERNFLARIVLRCAAVCPVVIVRGNHDALGDWSFLELLESRYPIRYFEEPATLDLREVVGDRSSAPLFVHAVPWLSPGWFASQVADLGLSIDEGHAWIEDAVRPVFADIRRQVEASPDALHVGVGHLSVRGGHLAGGQVLVGGEVQVGAEMLADLGLHYFGLGHLHEAQEVVPGAPVWYAGSPNRLDYGEAGKRCCFLLATLDADAGRTVVEYADLPADVLLTVDAEVWQTAEGLAVLDVRSDEISADDFEDADVRLRVVVPEGLAAEDAIAEMVAYIEQSGGRPVVQRITAAATRSRAGAAEVAARGTVADKVQTFLAQRDHDTEQTKRVLARLEAIEGRRA